MNEQMHPGVAGGQEVLTVCARTGQPTALYLSPSRDVVIHNFGIRLAQLQISRTDAAAIADTSRQALANTLNRHALLPATLFRLAMICCAPIEALVDPDHRKIGMVPIPPAGWEAIAKARIARRTYMIMCWPAWFGDLKHKLED